MNKRYIGIFGVVAALALLVSFLPQSAPVVKAGDQSWSDITLPSIVNAGAIRSLAVVDANTAFAITSNAVTAPGTASSFLVRTIDGGVTWTPVGNFNNANASAPPELVGAETLAPALEAATTELYLAVSPNYPTDKTLFIAINDPVTTIFQQVYRSKDGGDTFKIIGGDIVTAVTDGTERIRAISVAPNYTETSDNSVLLGTFSVTDNVAGGLYFYQTGFGGSWGAKTGASDVYAAVFTGGTSVVAIASLDNAAGDNAVAEFRITVVSGTVVLPTGVQVGAEVQGAATQDNHRWGLAFPSNWSAGTTTDRNVVVHSTGGAAPTGAVYQRNGTTASYTSRTSSVAFGFGSVAMTGNATTGTVFVGTDTPAAEDATTPLAKLVYSVDGGVTWSSITSGDRYGVDGVAVRTKVAIGGSSAIFAGTGGIRGGIFKSPNLGANWVDNAVYSDNIVNTVDFNLVDANNIFLVMRTGVTTETHSFKTENGGVSWRRIMRTANIAKIRTGSATANTYWAQRSNNIDGQIRRSTDGGFSWSATPTDPSDSQGVSDITASSDLALWTVLANSQIAYTADGGASWTLSTTSPSAATSGLTKNPNYAAADKAGYQTVVNFSATITTVWISRDNGASWTQFGAANFSGGNQGGVAWSPTYNTDKIVYSTGNLSGGATGALFKMVDDGTVTSTSTWTSVATLTVIGGGTATRIGTPSLSGSNVFVPVGDRVAGSFDIKRQPPDWRNMPLVGTAGVSTNVSRVSAKKNTAGNWQLWTWGPTTGVGGNGGFKVLTDTAVAPTLTAPANGAAGVARFSSLTWTGVPSATAYEVQLGLSPTLDGAATNLAGIVGAPIAITATGVETGLWYGGDGMTPGGTFYWRVRESAPIEGPYSPIFSFTVAGGPTPMPATPTPAPTDKLNLKNGWNLVSVPKSVANGSISAFFTGVTTIEKVYSFMDGTWSIASFSAGAWGGTLTELVAGKGYWIKATADTTVNISYKPVDPLDPPPAYELPMGWTLVGYTSLALTPNAPVSSYLLSVSGKWTSLYSFDPAIGYALSKPGGVGFTNVAMFQGYWIYMTAAGTLVP